MQNMTSDTESNTSEPLEIFFSYAHEDEELKNKLVKHLAAMKKENLIKNWSDREIQLSQDWKGMIDEKLNSADIILLLISPDFVASDYCSDVEMTRAMERYEKREAYVVPVILRPTDFGALPFAGLQAAPKNAKPAILWNTLDEAFYDVAVKLRQLVKFIKSKNE